MLKIYQLQVLEEQERQAVRRISSQERSHYSTLAACLKPVISEELTMLTEIEQLDEVMEKVGRIIADPANIPDNMDQVIRDIRSNGDSVTFASPPPSPGSHLGTGLGPLNIQVAIS